jgi:uncharacterized protein (DUF362 family)
LSITTLVKLELARIPTIEGDVHHSTKTQLNNSIKQLNKKGDTRGMHPNSLKNLKPNKDCSITRIIKEMLDQVAEERWLLFYLLG